MSGDSAGRQPSSVGERIRERRLALGLSQRSLAGDGVSYAYISRLEANDRRPSVRCLRTLAVRLGVSAYWLETGEDDPAEELARIVLDHHAGPLPPRAHALARKLLREPR